ncbi:hypothetical protein CSE16_09105 [Solibacillus sp. R5-41]|uniref:hypothetical protein n=1 Tax=Solibacillus sp. R5-41 TaxID=2048654 RepID=UPI000C1278F2|nr:hypothetical protein [Solibacillus sp. R5-41]ATP40189.1 hypothetical protein CSE16_09105 [Solibacillus sp. R5-41]
MAKKGKGKGFLGKAASFLGSIPSVANVAKKAVKSTAKKAAKSTMIESKASDSANFTYSDKQKLGGEDYFSKMLNSNDSRYSDFREKFDELKEENPGLE